MTSGYKGKNILITGGLGFIGSNLAIELVKKGANVEIYDSLIGSMGGNKFNIEPVKGRVKVTIADLRDEVKVSKSVKGKQIIFNLAGTLSHVDSMADPFGDLDVNCRSALFLLEACRKFNPKVKIVFAGTRNQYGKTLYSPTDEGHIQDPTDFNGISAIAAEKYHLLYGKVYGFPVVSLRMTNTFGPRHQMKHSKQGVLNWFIRQLMDGETVELMGGGDQIRDINFIDDVVDALILAGITKKSDGQIYNLGGSPLALRDFVDITIKVLGSGNWKSINFPRSRKAIEIGNYIANIKKINEGLGWQPKTKIEDGIRETISYYKINKQHYW